MSTHIPLTEIGPFSPTGRDLLRALAGAVLPADAGFGVPGADDPEILAAATALLAPRAAEIEGALRHLDHLADGGYATASAATRVAVAETALSTRSPGFGLLMTLLLQAYYQDDRVMQSLGMEPRPPFPLGYEVPEGDWSLLDPVRARPPFWRRAD